MSKQLEPVYLASCPFCEYCKLFASALTMAGIYGAHLLDHEREAVEEGRHRRTGAAQRMEGVARHLERLNAAQYN